MSFSILIVGIILVLIYYKPYWASLFCHVLFFSGLNVEMDGFFVNLRAIITFALFLKLFNVQRILFFKELSITWITFLLIFYVYVFISDLFNSDSPVFDQFKMLAVNFCLIHITASTYAYNKKILYYALIISGFVCLTDLIYTLVLFEEFPIRRITALFLGTEKETNHNFFGMICSFALIVSFMRFNNGKGINVKIGNWIMPILFFVGVLLSTSRSALLGLVIVYLIYIYKYKGLLAMSYSLFSIIIITVILFTIVAAFFEGTKFYNILEERVINEPMTVFYKWQGKVYRNKTIEGSGEWREESSVKALNIFLELPIQEQMFGIGTYGYVKRNYANGLQPHNGFFLLLIERGIFAFIFFGNLLLQIFYNINKSKKNSLFSFLFLFLVVYSLPQNSELTSSLMVIIIAALTVEYKITHITK